MRRFALVVAVFACRTTFDESTPKTDAPGPSAACVLADTYSDLSSIKEHIFKANCDGSACHIPSSTDSNIDLILTETPHTTLVNVESELDNRFKLVVPGKPNESYLLYMVQGIPPDQMVPPATDKPPNNPEGKVVKFMPGESQMLCREKIDALTRWVEGGAMPEGM